MPKKIKTPLDNSLARGYDFQTYIFRVLKQAAPEFKISKKAIGIVNELLVETYTRVLQESRDLM